jgi:DNA-binding NtrC family response regulator
MAYVRKLEKILVVEDEPTIRLMLSHALQEEGHEVFMAQSLQAAEEALERHPVSFVITDIRLSGMQRMEGLELLQYIKRHRPRTGVIIMTADLSAEVREKAYGLGAKHCFEKPFDFTEMMHCVQETGGAAVG